MISLKLKLFAFLIQIFFQQQLNIHYKFIKIILNIIYVSVILQQISQHRDCLIQFLRDNYSGFLLKGVNTLLCRVLICVFSHSLDSMPPGLLNFSNIEEETIYYPSRGELGGYRIIVSTLVNCGRFTNLKLPGYFFDFVFIDEAGQVKSNYLYVFKFPIRPLNLKP